MISLVEARDAYRGYAPAYDVLFGPFLQKARRRAIGFGNDQPAQNVLEIGIGTGLSLPYYRGDARVTGIDVSDEMLAKARERASTLEMGDRCRFMLMNAEDMMFADDSFDVVVGLFVASTVQNLSRFGAELCRVCKPTGRIVLVNHFSRQREKPLGVSRYLSRFSGILGFEPYFPLDNFLAQTGLRVKRIERASTFRRLTIVEATKSYAGMADRGS